MKNTGILLVMAILIIVTSNIGYAQVLGSCNTSDIHRIKKKASTVPHTRMVMHQPVQHLLLPGDKAINFSLPAVVGNTIKTVKLSDYSGKWRVICFYPGDFTFV